MRHHLSHVFDPLLQLGTLVVHILKMQESAVHQLVCALCIFVVGVQHSNYKLIVTISPKLKVAKVVTYCCILMHPVCFND